MWYFLAVELKNAIVILRIQLNKLLSNLGNGFYQLGFQSLAELRYSFTVEEERFAYSHTSV